MRTRRAIFSGLHERPIADARTHTSTETVMGSNTGNSVDSSIHALQCMEIWGSNETVHSAVSVSGIDAWIYSEPFEGGAVGGDVHYISMCGGGKISRFVVADVSGHGVTVGDVASRLRALMRKYINKLDQTRFARALNREFSRLAQDGQFATALLATYFAPSKHLVVCNIGHPKPLWYHAHSGRWELIEHEMSQRAEQVVNVPLGVIVPTDYVQFAVKLDQGDLVLIYTDWMREARNRDGEVLGEQGLLERVRQLDPTDPARLRRMLLESVAEYSGRGPAEDDQTLLVLHHNASDPPQQSLGEKLRVMSKMLGLTLS